MLLETKTTKSNANHKLPVFGPLIIRGNGEWGWGEAAALSSTSLLANIG